MDKQLEFKLNTELLTGERRIKAGTERLTMHVPWPQPIGYTEISIARCSLVVNTYFPHKLLTLFHVGCNSTFIGKKSVILQDL